MSKPTAHVYIDGFNLYKGALERTAFRWLNIEAWAERLLPQHHVKKVTFCTARIKGLPHDPGAPQRQEVYWRALATLPKVEIVTGTFRIRDSHFARKPYAHCDCCNHHQQPCHCSDGPLVRVTRPEEKGSDVNLAVELVRDAFMGEFDAALVVSGDSDLQSGIDVVRQELSLKVIVADPRNRKRRPLLGDEQRRVGALALERSQFPDVVVSRTGERILRPGLWEEPKSRANDKAPNR